VFGTESLWPFLFSFLDGRYPTMACARPRLVCESSQAFCLELLADKYCRRCSDISRLRCCAPLLSAGTSIRTLLHARCQPLSSWHEPFALMLRLHRAYRACGQPCSGVVLSRLFTLLWVRSKRCSTRTTDRIGEVLISWLLCMIPMSPALAVRRSSDESRNSALGLI
jgi:hypothetical protein